MEALKELLATLSFIIGMVLLLSVGFSGFNWFELFFCITCLGLAYFIWPSKKRGQRESDNLFLDILEIIIELPVDIFTWLLRLLSRIFRNKDGSVDIDIDF